MKVVKPGEDREVPRGVLGGAEISQATAGASNLYMGVFRVPAATSSRPHYHEGCESAVYMLSGTLIVRWGDHLEQEVRLEPRDLVYVPPGETHVLENPSETEAAEYVVARDSPTEDAVVVPWAQEGGPTAASGPTATSGPTAAGAPPRAGTEPPRSDPPPPDARPSPGTCPVGTPAPPDGGASA
jgi:uncharacterized RmlC-like cupin family protein